MTGVQTCALPISSCEGRPCHLFDCRFFVVSIHAPRVRGDKHGYAVVSVDRMADIIDRISAAHDREIAKLRECLKEAIREKCPFTRMSCKHGEPCDYECGTFKWRKALGEEGGAK